MSEDTEPKASADIRLYWTKSQTIPDMYTTHAGLLTAAVSPSIKLPPPAINTDSWYWRVLCDGCQMGNVTSGTEVDREDAILAAEGEIYRTAHEVLAAFTQPEE